MPGWINVPVRIETRNKLDALKRVDQSYDKLLNELMDEIQMLLEQHKKANNEQE